MELHHQDAFEYLRDFEGKFDVVIVDAPDPLEGGPAHQLYTQEFYGIVRERLTGEGMLAVQAGPTGPAPLRELLLGGRQHPRLGVPDGESERGVHTGLWHHVGLCARLPGAGPALDDAR